MSGARFTPHALTALHERDLDRAWVERIADAPEWTTPDPVRADRELRYGRMPERDGRILRVVCETDGQDVVVVTAFLDRRARRPS